MADRTVSVVLRATVDQYQRAMAQAHQETAALVREVKGLAQVSQKTANDLQPLGTAMLGVGTAFGVAGGLAVKSAIDFESAFAGVRKTVEGTEEELSALADGIRSMSREVPATALEIAGVAEAAGALGVETGSILEFTRVMIDLGETTNLTAEQAATAFARVANVMGTAQSEFDRMGSVVVALGNNGASTEAEIVELANRLAAAGEIAGLTEANVFAFAETLASVGVEAEAGGTALSKVFTSVRDAVIDGSDKLDVFAKVAGMSSSRFQKAFQQDAAGAIASFIEGLGRISEAGQSTTTVFEALELTDQRLMRALLSTGSAGDYLRQQIGLANQAWEDNNALTEEAAKRYETTAAQLEMLRNNLTDIAVSVGSAALPVLNALAAAAVDLFDAIRDMPAPLQALMVIFGLLVGTVTLLGGAFLFLLPRIIATRAALATLATAAPRAAAGLRAVSVATGVIGVGLTAVTLAMALFNDEAEETETVAEGITEAFDALGRGQTAAAQKLLLGSLSAKGLLDQLNDLGITAEAVAEIMTTHADGSTKNVAAMQAWRSALDDAVASGKITREEADALSREVFKLGNDFSALAGGSSDVQAGLSQIGVSADEASESFAGGTDAVSEYGDELDNLLGKAFGVDEAVQSLAADLLDFGNSVIDAQREGKAFASSLDETNVEGLKNLSTLRQLASGALDVAREMKALGASDDEIATQMASFRDEIIATLTPLGFEEQAVRNVLDVLLQVPGEYRANVTADTTDAETKLRNLLELIRTLQREEGFTNLNVISSGLGLGAAKPPASLLGGTKPTGTATGSETRQTADARKRVEYEFGGVSVADYKAYLAERIDATAKYSDEWAELMREMDRVNKEIGAGWKAAADEIKKMEDEWMRVLDVQNQVGDLSNQKYLRLLEERLAELKEYSTEWFDIWNKIKDLKEETSQTELQIIEAVENQRLFDVAFYAEMDQRRLSAAREGSVVVQGGSTTNLSLAATVNGSTDPYRDLGTASQRMRDDAFLLGL